MSAESTNSAKADQIGFRFHTKVVSLVSHARSPTPSATTPNQPSSVASSSSAKIDKWFNLELPDASDIIPRDVKDRYRTLSQAGIPPAPSPSSSSSNPSTGSSSATTLPPFEINVLLTIPDLNNTTRALVHFPSSKSEEKTRLVPTPSSILLERWILSFSPQVMEEEIAPPTMYKHSIPIFRSLYALLRILPAWNVYKRMQGRRKRDGLGLAVVVPSPTMSTSDTLDFDTPLSLSHPSPHPSTPLPTDTYSFPPIPHPSGYLRLEVRYLREGGSQFRIEELESLLSDRFVSADREAWEEEQRRRRKKIEPSPMGLTGPSNEDVDFVPTLVKNQQRDSLVSTTGGGGIARSPPIPITVRDRRISQLSSGGGGLESSGPSRLSTSPPSLVSRVLPGVGSGGSPSGRRSPMQPSSSTARLRRETSPRTSPSLYTVALPSTTSSSPSPAGHPTQNPSPSSQPSTGSQSKRPPLVINPFKSSTVSQSPALHIPIISDSMGSMSPSSIPSNGLAGMGAGPIQTLNVNLSKEGVAFPSVKQTGGPTSPQASPTVATRLSASPASPPPSAGTTPPSAAQGGGAHRPFAPSSLSSVTSSSGTGQGPTRKRYSSNFGHRYSTSGGGAGRGESPAPGNRRVSYAGDTRSVVAGVGGSPNPGTVALPPVETTPPSTGPVDEAVDPDGYDGRKQPLGISGSGRVSHIRSLSFHSSPASPTSSAEQSGYDFQTHGPSTAASTNTGTSTLGRRSAVGEVLRTEGEVDQRLREMNEIFVKSLEGLGSGRRGRRPEIPDILAGPSGSSTPGSGSGSGSGSGVVGRMDLGG